MSLAQDLLEQSRQLSILEPRRPKQSSLRRSISAAYYALFHLLIEEGTKSLVSQTELRMKFARAFDHGDMKDASRAFSNPNPSKLKLLTGGMGIPLDLQNVALAFIELQEARHEADYNVGRTFARSESISLISRAEKAFASWQVIRTDPAAKAYLAALLLWKEWNR